MSVYTIAEEFVQLTGCNLFLTGKAGTGKTTFLRKMREVSRKEMVVVAPTGVAAINAGGVTIHSFFQLPFAPFVPTKEGAKNLISKQQMASHKREIIRKMEILVIDEVSMVRADLLDAIDAVMRYYRHNQEPFGGVQVIFIGDLYQLSPVVKQEDKQLLDPYYDTYYFFDSQAIRKKAPVYLELDKVFRQSNQQFIQILNEVRNNQLSSESLELLNRRYFPDFKPASDEGFINLTTHNRKADAINQSEMAQIENPEFRFKADIKGTFGERTYPNDEELVLKEGAKVMFIANDVGLDRKYYNGKIGTICSISSEEIWIDCDDEDAPILCHKELWQNVKYSINKENGQIDEDVQGTFFQYPLRLAWAITIHKSQGLTFDKVVIDAESAFASGQVYVALSRCRSLDGIILTSHILPSSLQVDKPVVHYTSNKLAVGQLESLVQQYKMVYNIDIIKRAFYFEPVYGLIDYFLVYEEKFLSDFNEETKVFSAHLRELITAIYNVDKTFQRQISKLGAAKDAQQLSQRVAAGSDYYVKQLEELLEYIEFCQATTDSRTQAQDFQQRLLEIYETLDKMCFVIKGIHSDYSVSHYFELRNSYKPILPKLRIFAGSKVQTLTKIENKDLFASLATWRNEQVEIENKPVYMVASTKTLIDICKYLPQSLEALQKIKGMGVKKVEAYGDLIVDYVNTYCEKMGFSSQMKLFEEEEAVEKEVKKQDRKLKKAEKLDEAPYLKEEHQNMTKTVNTTYEWMQKGDTVEEIAEERNMTTGTIEYHQSQMIQLGVFPIADFIKTKVLKKMLKKMEGSKTLKENFDLFDGEYSYSEIRFVLAHLKYEESLQE